MSFEEHPCSHETSDCILFINRMYESVEVEERKTRRKPKTGTGVWSACTGNLRRSKAGLS